MFFFLSQEKSCVPIPHLAQGFSYVASRLSGVDQKVEA